VAAKRSKRAEIRKQRLARKRRERVITMIVVAGVILLVGGLLVLASGPSASPPAEPTLAGSDLLPPPPHPHPHADMNAIGDPNAPVTIIEYSDFQCPFCGRFARETEPLLIRDYVETGKVRLIYRTFGDWIGPESLRAAEAAYCAGDQGKFWEFHDVLFYNQHGENQGAFSRERIDMMAQMLGLDMDAFGKCLDSHKYRQQAMQDLKDGQAAGVKGTPSFLVIAPDGSQQFIEGAQPYPRFQEAIEAALQKKKP